MNATNFFTEQQFKQLKKDIAEEKIMSLCDTPYSKEIKTNGNKYKITISTGRYTYKEAYGQYYVSLWDDYHYNGNIGGGNGGRLNLDSFEAFKESINKVLSRFPDYKEEEQPLQYAMDF